MIDLQMLSASLLCALDAHVHLVRSTESRVLLCTKSTLPLVEKIESQYSPAQHFIVPDLLDFLPVDAHEGDQWPIYPYDATWDTAKDHPCLVIHTSGSTGLPKLVAYTHRMLAGPARSRYIPPLNGCTPIYQEFADRRMFFTLPIFHVCDFRYFASVELELTPSAVSWIPWILDLSDLLRLRWSHGSPG